jgi:[ribosomal protein S5]-alanine N-acetyltransferase
MHPNKSLNRFTFLNANKMQLLPIELDESKNVNLRKHPECAEVLEMYPEYYRKIGFQKPWIGYLASPDGEVIVGMAGFKGGPKNSTVEIAYHVFPAHEGQGVGTEICRELVQIAQQTDPTVRVTARTLPDGQASIRILQKNGFVCLGVVQDEDDGEVLEWEFRG